MSTTKEPIILAAARSTPAVRFDAGQNILEISGESYPENAFEFYSPLIEWLNDYASSLETSAVLELRLAYLNTSSTRCMLMLIDVLDMAFQDGKDVRVRWYYHADDDRALETAEEFSDGLILPFDIIAVAE